MAGLPKLDLFQVKFDMEQVWDGDGQYGPRDTVTADIYENWLEPIED